MQLQIVERERIVHHTLPKQQKITKPGDWGGVMVIVHLTNDFHL